MAKIKSKTSVLHQNTQQSLFQGEAQFLTGGDGRNFPSQVRELSPAWSGVNPEPTVQSGWKKQVLSAWFGWRQCFCT